MSRFFSEKYAVLVPYTPGEQPQDQQYVKLNTNESPFPPSEKALRAALDALRPLQLYSDPECRRLREKLAARYGVAPDEVTVTNGSDEALNFCFMAFCDAAHGAVFPNISYGFYPVFAQVNGVPYTEIPLKADFSVDADDYCGVGKTVFIANPNAPTGKLLPPAEIEKILQTNPDNVVVIDEAYVDFGGVSCIPLVRRYDNLLVVQTFSKARSMAGARLGFALADAGLIEDLETIRCCTNPYNVNRMTMAAAIATLKNDEYNMGHCAVVARTRQKVAAALREMGFFVTDSRSNFLFARPPRGGGKALYLALKERGVLVRFLSGERTKDFVRVTVGSEEEMEIFLRETRSILDQMGEAER
jgi:histidinol-phosphate aminotransferase